MTHTPRESGAPPATGTPPVPAIPPQQTSAPPVPLAPPPQPPARRTAFAEGADRLREAATTEPGRLRVIGALLALLVVSFGAVTAWQMTDRASAADDVLTSSQPLSSDAADIYRSLADANTAASSGYLAGLQEKPSTRQRYEDGIRTAASKLVTAAANSDPDSESARIIARLNDLLPVYKGLVETARANNRQGYPVGGAYLRAANDTMQQQMLPSAERLYQNENDRLRADYADAKSFPWLATLLGLAALAGLAWVQRRTYLRTNRVLNHGLVTASAATAVVLLWLVVGHTVARAGLNSSYDHGVRSLDVLHDARIASLTARGDENLVLVSRGAETTKVKGQVVDAFDAGYDRQIQRLADSLKQAEALADDAEGKKPVGAADAAMKQWRQRHALARADNDSGNYQAARDRVIGASKEPTSVCFDSVDAALQKALTHEESEFERSARDGRDALVGLPAGAAVLAVLGAAGAATGIGRRLSEYR